MAFRGWVVPALVGSLAVGAASLAACTGDAGDAAAEGAETEQSENAASTRDGGPAPAFRGGAAAIDPATRATMTGVSYRPTCPVPLDDLRLLTLDHWGFDGVVHVGKLVVHQDQAEAMVRVFGALFAARYPIARMQLVDAYGGDDDRSMADNNTSAFNCRPKAGRTTGWSEHSYGRAIDVNPIQNPYVSTRGAISPTAGARYATRTLREPGMIHEGDAVVRAFAGIDWKWGGAWRSSRDYQHFSLSGL